jgi:hypothetical protein
MKEKMNDFIGKSVRPFKVYNKCLNHVLSTKEVKLTPIGRENVPKFKNFKKTLYKIRSHDLKKVPTSVTDIVISGDDT